MKHIVSDSNAENIWEWFQNRGGIAIWESEDLSDPGKSWTTPLQKEDGTPLGKQHWQMSDKPARTITDPDDVEVHVLKEYKRFRVGIQSRRGGLRFELTRSSTEKLRKEVAQADERCCNGKQHASYEFDYDTQEAVILIPEKVLSLRDYIECQKATPGTTDSHQRANKSPDQKL